MPIRRNFQEVRLELLARRNVHRDHRVGKFALLQHDRDFEAVRRRPVIKRDRLCAPLFRGALAVRGSFGFAARHAVLLARHRLLTLSRPIQSLTKAKGVGETMKSRRRPRVSRVRDCV